MFKKSFLSAVLVGLMLAFSSGNAYAQSSNEDEKEFFRLVLESFCQKYYERCYDKTYKDYSLEVLSVKQESLESVLVKGKHGYKARTNHSNVDFKAYIKKNSDGLEVTFYKWYEPDLLMDGHWEKSCVRTITL